MVKCAVPFCKNDSRKQNKKNNNISFHRFPKSRDVINAWVNAIKRPNWEPNIRSFVCSVHFKSSFISETKHGLRKLVEGAIPELHLKNVVNNSVNVIPPTGELMAVAEDGTLDFEAKSNLVEQAPPSTSSGKILSSTLVPDDYTPNPTDTPQKLKRRLLNLDNVAKRRRLRCNALYVQRNRLNKKIKSLTEMLSKFRKKELITQEHNDILEVCGVSAAEHFQRIRHKGKTYSPELRAFALTFHFCSPKAYAFVRACVEHH